ncbi:MAG: YtxH domain-containing protein [Acidobacteria bacterium]|nr:YtxH domain-containing protein [Acidobacteriota bacterium]
MSRTTIGEKFIWGLAGLGIGAGIALLLAPKTGREARRYLKRMAEDGRERVVETGEQVFEKGKEAYEHGKAIVDDAMEFVDRGRKAVFR